MCSFKKIVTLSFDDGTVQDRRFINILDKYGLKCTFNINSGFFGNVHCIDREGTVVSHCEIPADEIADLYKNHEVAVHTVTHPNLLNCDDKEVIHQVLDDYNTLCKVGRQPLVGMAYPCGGNCYDERVMKLIADNTPIHYARTTNNTGEFKFPQNFLEWNPTTYERNGFDYNMALIKKFVEAKATEDMLFYFWGHSFELDIHEKFWIQFEELCKAISNHDDIDYMTNGEVYQYVMSKNT